MKKQMIFVYKTNVTLLYTLKEKNMILGYARCSLNESRQDISRQKRELHALGVKEDKHIYWEYESGVKDDRAELQKLLDIPSLVF